MPVRGPNDVGRAVQMDPTLLRYALGITEQKKFTSLNLQKITSLYRKSSTIVPSRSLPTMWVKYPKNKVVLCCMLTFSSKTSNLVISRRRYAEFPQKVVPKCVSLVQNDYFSSFNQ